MPVFTLRSENEPLKGCTVSHEIFRSVVIYSLDEDTDISPESYRDYKLLILSSGKIKTCKHSLTEGEAIITPVNVPVGIEAVSSSVYIKIGGIIMNEAVKPGEVFKLSELVPYQEGKIISMDVASNDKMKFAVMSFAEGTGLSEHAAPGDALIFALDGEGIIGYEGHEYAIKAGENFRFAKNGKHYVKAVGKFKMALLLTLEG